MPLEGDENRGREKSIRRTVEKPERPDNIPDYVADGIERQDVPILHDIVVFSEELIQFIQQPPSEDTDDLTDEQEELLESVQGENWTQVQKMVDCGKQCSGCPHGPYLYLVRRESPTKLQWEYVGPASSVAAEFPDLLDEEPSTTDEGRVSEDELHDDAKDQLEKIRDSDDAEEDDTEQETPPEPPSAIPAYISDGIERQSEDTLDSIIRYSQDLMEYEEYEDYKKRVDDPNTAVETPQVPSFDDVDEESWSDDVDPKNLETGDIVKVLNAEEIEYQSAEVEEFKSDKVTIVTQTGERLQFDMNGYSERFDVIESEYIGKTGQNK